MANEPESQQAPHPEALDAIHFVASTLAPFFLHDPALESAALLPLFDALTKIDAEKLAKVWPFVEQAAFYPYAAMLIADARTEGIGDRASTPEQSPYKLNELAAEYRRLFVGPAKKAAPQWGSVYTDKDLVTFGNSTMQLEDWLFENEIVVSYETSDEPEDSLGALLALLAWLTNEKPHLVLDLLRLHILPWSSHFLNLMEEATQHDFYRGLAGVTRMSLEGMRDAFDLCVETPRFYR